MDGSEVVTDCESESLIIFFDLNIQSSSITVNTIHNDIFITKPQSLCKGGGMYTYHTRVKVTDAVIYFVSAHSTAGPSLNQRSREPNQQLPAS